MDCWHWASIGRFEVCKVRSEITLRELEFKEVSELVANGLNCMVGYDAIGRIDEDSLAVFIQSGGSSERVSGLRSSGDGMSH